MLGDRLFPQQRLEVAPPQSWLRFCFFMGVGSGVQRQPGLLPWQLCLPLDGRG